MSRRSLHNSSELNPLSTADYSNHVLSKMGQQNGHPFHKFAAATSLCFDSQNKIDGAEATKRATQRRYAEELRKQITPLSTADYSNHVLSKMGQQNDLPFHKIAAATSLCFDSQNKIEEAEATKRAMQRRYAEELRKQITPLSTADYSNNVLSKMGQQNEPPFHKIAAATSLCFDSQNKIEEAEATKRATQRRYAEELRKQISSRNIYHNVPDKYAKVMPARSSQELQFMHMKEQETVSLQEKYRQDLQKQIQERDNLRSVEKHLHRRTVVRKEHVNDPSNRTIHDVPRNNVKRSYAEELAAQIKENKERRLREKQEMLEPGSDDFGIFGRRRRGGGGDPLYNMKGKQIISYGEMKQHNTDKEELQNQTPRNEATNSRQEHHAIPQGSHERHATPQGRAETPGDIAVNSPVANASPTYFDESHASEQGRNTWREELDKQMEGINLRKQQLKEQALERERLEELKLQKEREELQQQYAQEKRKECVQAPLPPPKASSPAVPKRPSGPQETTRLSIKGTRALPAAGAGAGVPQSRKGKSINENPTKHEDSLDFPVHFQRPASPKQNLQDIHTEKPRHFQRSASPKQNSQDIHTEKPRHFQRSASPKQNLQDIHTEKPRHFQRSASPKQNLHDIHTEKPLHFQRSASPKQNLHDIHTEKPRHFQRSASPKQNLHDMYTENPHHLRTEVREKNLMELQDRNVEVGIRNPSSPPIVGMKSNRNDAARAHNSDSIRAPGRPGLPARSLLGGPPHESVELPGKPLSGPGEDEQFLDCRSQFLDSQSSLFPNSPKYDSSRVRNGGNQLFQTESQFQEINQPSSPRKWSIQGSSKLIYDTSLVNLDSNRPRNMDPELLSKMENLSTNQRNSQQYQHSNSTHLASSDFHLQADHENINHRSSGSNTPSGFRSVSRGGNGKRRSRPIVRTDPMQLFGGELLSTATQKSYASSPQGPSRRVPALKIPNGSERTESPLQSLQKLYDKLQDNSRPKSQYAKADLQKREHSLGSTTHSINGEIDESLLQSFVNKHY